jgi:hypothetical protein
MTTRWVIGVATAIAGLPANAVIANAPVARAISFLTRMILLLPEAVLSVSVVDRRNYRRGIMTEQDDRGVKLDFQSGKFRVTGSRSAGNLA